MPIVTDNADIGVAIAFSLEGRRLDEGESRSSTMPIATSNVAMFPGVGGAAPRYPTLVLIVS